MNEGLSLQLDPCGPCERKSHPVPWMWCILIWLLEPGATPSLGF